MQPRSARKSRSIFLKRLRVLRVLRGCLFLLIAAGCNSEPTTWRDLQSSVAGLDAAQKDAAIEKFIAARHGTPIIENQSRLIFLAKKKNGQAPRIVGDFKNWAATSRGYDVRSEERRVG